jgi:hypothetical protein
MSPVSNELQTTAKDLNINEGLIPIGDTEERYPNVVNKIE